MAVNLDNKIRDYISTIQGDVINVEDSQIKIKMVENSNLHISLKFLGDLNSLEIEKILIALQKVSFKTNSFNISLSKGIGVFPNSKKPRVLWIGIEKGAEELKRIHYFIEQELINESFYIREKIFTPHITLGRIKYIKYPSKLIELENNIKYKDISQKIISIDFMESNLTSKGPIYNKISYFPFLQ
ncbi:MAG: RNA 2',3'-cyclic phosphodiesterase [Candidatus Caldatribacteriota bacterium]|nr:RNA 2',3'-cyclic phosphodiesterase [Atribacterota bacterium]MDD3030974.1 RNA 2',3'-cyclic phosphodiesterase [Atribacterota bacterium]MDD3640466.1 RNA 2',3'-cyclic phosphodiesterase [Atribacterota bacterium]MDD4289231.1 RNA 2',3'-cyclic phosphodiesterase [Atribacterota bacterium]MDD5636109.1 RNA 2',3'-cyclic phosphodiesterase [Atribacterota bacterium]